MTERCGSYEDQQEGLLPQENLNKFCKEERYDRGRLWLDKLYNCIIMIKTQF